MKRSTMTAGIPRPNSRAAGLARDGLRWGLALAILWFLGSRLATDWPTVRPALRDLDWAWMAISLIPGAAYFGWRISAWRMILAELQIRATWVVIGRIWANGEMIRYIPGNVWSILGRVAQSATLGATRTAIFASMVVETLILLLAAAGLSAAGLQAYPGYDAPWRPLLLLAIGLTTLIAATSRPLNALMKLAEKILRRREPIGRVSSGPAVYAVMVLAWTAFALFQLAIAASLGAVPDAQTAIAMSGAFTLSWLLGYLSFLTPSGLGVREAALVFLLRPFMDTPTAVLIAVVSRVVMIVVELGVVAVLNLAARKERPA